MWIEQLLMEVGIKTSILGKHWCDNQATLYIASNLVFHERTKPIEIDFFFRSQENTNWIFLYMIWKDKRIVE